MRRTKLLRSSGLLLSAQSLDALNNQIDGQDHQQHADARDGGKVDRAARYIAPTVLYGTSPDAPVMKEEIFGPILPILVVEDAESAIRFINKRSRPLAAYVFSRDHEVRLTFERQTSSGALGYSLPLGHLLSSRLPFGGVGASGIGTYHGKAGFLPFSHVKTVVTKPQFPDTLRLVYPPFNEAKAKLFDIIAKFS